MLSEYLKLSSDSKSTKTDTINVGELSIEVLRKNIKNLHLGVYPPSGRVRIAAPLRMSLETIRLYAIAKLGWIRKHQAKFRNQHREAPREYISGESHFFLGKRYLLKVVEEEAPAKVIHKHDTLELYIRPKTNKAKRAAILDEWYRIRLKELIPTMIAEHEPRMKVQVKQWGVKKMRTKWGTCNIRAQRIWLNLELAKKPLRCIEHVVVHEMVHLLERKHNERFLKLMDSYLPQWRQYKEELNRFPVNHVQWDY
ncbi:MAG: M48 family metallopeptidase [Bacteroidota bacterium]